MKMNLRLSAKTSQETPLQELPIAGECRRSAEQAPNMEIRSLSCDELMRVAGGPTIDNNNER